MVVAFDSPAQGGTFDFSSYTPQSSDVARYSSSVKPTQQQREANFLPADKREYYVGMFDTELECINHASKLVHVPVWARSLVWAPISVQTFQLMHPLTISICRLLHCLRSTGSPLELGAATDDYTEDLTEQELKEAAGSNFISLWQQERSRQLKAKAPANGSEFFNIAKRSNRHGSFYQVAVSLSARQCGKRLKKAQGLKKTFPTAQSAALAADGYSIMLLKGRCVEAHESNRGPASAEHCFVAL